MKDLIICFEGRQLGMWKRVTKETDKAWGVNINKTNYSNNPNTEWIPKSLANVIDVLDKKAINDRSQADEAIQIDLPEWLLIKKGIL